MLNIQLEVVLAMRSLSLSLLIPLKGIFFQAFLSGGLTQRWGGGLFERGSLLILVRMMVSVLRRDLERKVEILKYMKLEVMQPTMEDKILRTINTICLNFSPFPPLP